MSFVAAESLERQGTSVRSTALVVCARPRWWSTLHRLAPDCVKELLRRLGSFQCRYRMVSAETFLLCISSMFTTYVAQMLVLLHGPHISLMKNVLDGFLWGEWGSGPLGVLGLFNLIWWTVLQKGSANWKLERFFQRETMWMLFSFVLHYAF